MLLFIETVNFFVISLKVSGIYCITQRHNIDPLIAHLFCRLTIILYFTASKIPMLFIRSFLSRTYCVVVYIEKIKHDSRKKDFLVSFGILRHLKSVGNGVNFYLSYYTCFILYPCTSSLFSLLCPLVTSTVGVLLPSCSLKPSSKVLF